jgi:hypothetical protein
MRVNWRFVVLATALACRPGEPRVEAERSTARPETASNTVASAQTASESVHVCARPARGIIVGHDSVAGFSTHATLGALRQQCGLGNSALYDAVGWQGVAWTFPFVGASVMAVQSKHGYGEAVHDDEAPDLWVVEGDSVRLPDGELVPPTLGALRARYGFEVDENINADDIDGPSARSCRFPYLSFSLSVHDTARKVPDSARVTRVEMDTPGADTVFSRFCDAHRPPNGR